MSKLGNLARRSSTERALLVESVVRLAVLRVLLALIGTDRRTALFGPAVTPAAGSASLATMTLTDLQRSQAKAVAWSIARAEAALPFTVNCLPQALIGRRMLRNRGIASVMFFGVERDKDVARADTHAWLMAGDVPITGHRLMAQYEPFAAFPRTRPVESP